MEKEPPAPPPSGARRDCSLPWLLAWVAIVAAAAAALACLLYFLLPLALRADATEDGTPASSASRKEASNPLLLPTALRPFLYHLKLTTFLDYNRMHNNSFLGELDIDLACLRRTNLIRFHALNLSFAREHVAIRALDGAALGTANASSTWNPESIDFDNYTQMATLTFGDDLQAGRNYTLSIARFVGRIRIDAKGLYLSSYHTATGKLRFLAATQFEVAEARKVFPCWDEPRFKAQFRVTIVRRESMRSIANMPRIKSKARGDGFVEDHYETSVVMSTYLVAFVVSDFQGRSAVTEDGIRVEAFARPDLVEEVHHALDMTVRTLKYFRDYFDIPYALTKLDLIALPDFSHGAMENWGLITFKEKTMLYNPQLHPRGQKEHVSMIVGHEVAHQWFGNLVTMEWWNDLWLNEGFSHYMGYVATAAVDPDEPMEHVFILANVMEALKMDSMLSTHPVLNEVFHPDEIVTLFDTITYKKGSCLIRMMVHFLGEDVMRTGLQIYLKRHSFGNTVSSDLWAALNEAVELKSAGYQRERMGELSVLTVMDNWIRQTGYPIVTVQRRYDGSRTALLEQRRFVLSAHRNDSNLIYNETWIIPFTYTTAAEQRWDAPTITWLKTQQKALNGMPGNSEWVMGNINLNGFYRVNYDDRNWGLILQQLLSDYRVFSVPQRAQILDSAFELASAELLDIRLALNSTLYLRSETEYLAWSVGFSSLKYVDTMLQDDPAYASFVRYARHLVTDVYFRLGWEERAGEHKHTSYLRNIVTDQACYYGIPDCLRRARDLFHTWMRTESLEHIPLTLRSVVQCQGIREGGQMEWDWVWRQYANATGNTERMVLLKGLSCTKDTALIKRLLAASLNGAQVKTWHVSELMRELSRFLSGRQAAWDFIRNNWASLYKRLKELTGDLGSCLKYFSEEFRLQEMEAFLARIPAGPETKKFTQYRETIEFNIHWRKRHAVPALEWLGDWGRRATAN